MCMCVRLVSIGQSGGDCHQSRPLGRACASGGCISAYVLISRRWHRRQCGGGGCLRPQSLHSGMAVGTGTQQLPGAQSAVHCTVCTRGPTSGLEVHRLLAHKMRTQRLLARLVDFRGLGVFRCCTLRLCVAPTAVSWRRFSQGQLVNIGTGLCVDSVAGSDPGLVQLCNASAPSQLWSLQVCPQDPVQR
jgi:hypothetical protein